MIYIIGGAPRVGKSIVGKKLAEVTQASFVSTDDLDEQVSSALTEEERKIKFPMPGFSGNAAENILSPEELVRRSVISAKSTEPEIDSLISSGIASKKSFVIEGIHLLPEYVRALQERFGANEIRAIFIGLNDVDEVIQGIVKNTSPDNWMRNSNLDVIRQVAEFVSSFSSYIKKEAERNRFEYMERTTDFEGDFKRAIEKLSNASEAKISMR